MPLASPAPSKATVTPEAPGYPQKETRAVRLLLFKVGHALEAQNRQTPPRLFSAALSCCSVAFPERECKLLSMGKAGDMEDALERLTTMVQVIGETPRVLEKANTLYRTPLHQRNLVLQGIISHMEATGEDPEIIRTFKLFAVPCVYMGAMEALHDSGYLQR